MKKVISIFSMICLILTSFSLTAFAADEPSVVVKDAEEDIESIQPRFPGNASVTRVTIYPKKMDAGGWYNASTVVTNFGSSSFGQTEITTINDATMEAYTKNNCDGFRVEVNLNRANADWYKVYINNELADESYMAGSSTAKTFYLNVPVIDGKATWEIILSNVGESNGKPFTHYIYLQEE